MGNTIHFVSEYSGGHWWTDCVNVDGPSLQLTDDDEAPCLCARPGDALTTFNVVMKR